MGDRTSLQIVVLKKHKEICLNTEGQPQFEDSSEDVPGAVILSFDEVNYGGINLRDELCRANIPFFGHHLGGNDYVPLVFAHDGKDEHTCRFDPDTGALVLLVDSKYKREVRPTEETIKMAKDYRKALTRTLKVMRKGGK